MQAHLLIAVLILLSFKIFLYFVLLLLVIITNQKPFLHMCGIYMYMHVNLCFEICAENAVRNATTFWF